MKDKHISVEADSRIMQQLHHRIREELVINQRGTAVLLSVKAVVYVSLLVLTYSALLMAGNSLVFLAAYIAYGLVVMLLGFNFAHDCSHNTVFRSKRANQLCFTLLYTLAGAHAEAWKHRHVHAHHYAPNVRGHDSDLQITNLIRVEPDAPHLWFHRYQHWYAPLAYTTYSLYWVFIKDFVIYFNPERRPDKRSLLYHGSFWLQKAAYFGYLLVLPMAYADQPWLMVLFAFLAMHAVQSLFLLFTFFMTHHTEATQYFKADADGHIQVSWLGNQVRSSNDFYPFSRTANFIFGGFNNHIAHHLFPHIHHAHYPQLNRILYRILGDHGIRPNVTSYFGGVRSHLRHLRAQGRQPAR